MKRVAVAFRNRGYYGSTLESIARAARVTKSNLYYYFKDKREILYFWHDYSMDLFLDALARVEASHDSPAEKLRALLMSFICLMLDDLRGGTLHLNLEALSPAQYRKINAKRDQLERGFRRIIQSGIDEGIFYFGDPKLITFAILGAVNWIPVWFDPNGRAGTQEIASVFANYLVSRLSSSAPQKTEPLRSAVPQL